MDAETTLKRFTAGELSAEELAKALHDDADEMERYLDNDPDQEPYNYVRGSVFQFLLGCELQTASGALDAQGAIADFFDRNGVSYDRDPGPQELYDLMLRVQPGYVGADVDWLVERYSKHPEWNDEEGREEWLRRRIVEDFRFHKNPPDWIQDPSWAVGPEGPYLFVGQLEVEGLFHDAAAIYVFYDPRTGHTENVIQVM